MQQKKVLFFDTPPPKQQKMQYQFACKGTTKFAYMQI